MVYSYVHLYCIIGIIVDWGTGNEEIILLDTSEGGETKSKYISPILRLYVVVLIIDHASRNVLLLMAGLRPRPWIAYPNTPLQAKTGLSN